MSVQSEFSKYRLQGGKESLEQYSTRYNSLKKEIGIYIVDYNNRMTGIGKLIFENSDLNSKIAISQTCSKTNVRSKKDWFERDSRAFILKYIQQGTSFLDYLAEGGWQEGATQVLKVAGVALTIHSFNKAGEHSKKIPADAPRTTRTYTDADTGREYEYIYIDHPEARKADAWVLGCAFSAMATTALVCSGIQNIIDGIDVDTFFSMSQKEIIKPQSFFAFRWTFPEFYNWKWRKLREQLTSNPNPTIWRKDPELIRMICPISKDLMLFPVKDNCEHSHYFDYRSVRAFQLKNRSISTSCPLNRKQPNRGFMIIKFDKGMFDFIQSRLNLKPGESLDCIHKRYLGEHDSSDNDFSDEDLI